jgi:hypothetical protein
MAAMHDVAFERASTVTGYGCVHSGFAEEENAADRDIDEIVQIIERDRSTFEHTSSTFEHTSSTFEHTKRRRDSSSIIAWSATANAS